MSLNRKLLLAMLVVLVGLGIGYVSLSNWSNARYSQEVTQRLNAMIAQYVVAEEDFFANGTANLDALQHVAQMAMIINPAVEVYLLDTDGRILGHGVPAEQVRLERVNIEPLEQYLRDGGAVRGPVFGDDPRDSESQRVFSVAPVMADGELAGYLYVVLGGATYQSIAEAVHESHILRVYVAAAVALLLFAVLTSVLVFSFLTRRLSTLVKRVDAFSASGFLEPVVFPTPRGRADEIDFLASTFNELSATVVEHISRLKQTDRTRRELIANVSHDLRTPIASMQGYIDTLLIKHDTLSAQQRDSYLRVASKHGCYLGKLVDDLFELSCLDSGLVKPKREVFSMNELVQDVVQKYQLQAAQARIRLEQDIDGDLSLVDADIGMIQQVLENLISNALKHTPVSGKVSLSVVPGKGAVVTTIADTGMGIPNDDLPYIFDRAYKASNSASNLRANAGLGLAIVKKILELHHAPISVHSHVGAGCAFRFELPVAVGQH
ncbi:MAG: two-component system OmpR family sensor kinase [Gammaproteobacteria bacterium]|jgi:two-component system OmpR family sensor kinase